MLRNENAYSEKKLGQATPVFPHPTHLISAESAINFFENLKKFRG